jgi:flagellar motor switch protein FliG
VNESRLSGSQKTAVLMLTLGDEFAGKVFSKLGRREIAKISKAMSEMESIPKETVEAVLKEFNETIAYGKDLLVAGPDEVRRLISGNLDKETAKYIMDSLDMDSGSSPFKELENVSPKLLAQILRSEHPQTLALVIGYMPSESAAHLLQNLPAGIRPEVLMRLARLESVPEDTLIEVDRVLQSQLIAMGGREGRKVGGALAVAEILNAVDRSTEEEVLAEIEEESGQLAEDIRQLMFVFEDINSLDDRSIRELLKEISNDELTLALKGSSEELKAKFFGNLSERAGTMIREDLEIMGPVRLSDVEAAQGNIVRTVRRLEAEGRIVIAGKGGSDVLI